MTKHLNSLGEMALELIKLEAGEFIALSEALERIAQKVEDTAKAEFGVYQPATGGFPAWPELADSTQDERVKAGYSADEPLLRSGETQASISHEVEGLEAVVGSTSDVMVFHEFGTSKMPARPVIGPAAFRNRDWIQRLAAAAVVAGFIGEDVIHQALGYDFKG